MVLENMEKDIARCTHFKFESRPAFHCRVLPPGEFNDMVINFRFCHVIDPLHVCCESVMVTAVTVTLLTNKLGDKQTSQQWYKLTTRPQRYLAGNV